MEQLHVTITVKDESGKLIKDSLGFNQSDLQYDIPTKGRTSSIAHINQVARTLSVWMPERLIQIIGSCHNRVGGTYDVLYSLEVRWGEIGKIKKH
jgi:hypothetical protein